MEERLAHSAGDVAGAVPEARRQRFTFDMAPVEQVGLVEADQGAERGGAREPGVDLEDPHLAVHQPALDVQRPAGSQRLGDPLAGSGHLGEGADLTLGDPVAHHQLISERRVSGPVRHPGAIAEGREDVSPHRDGVHEPSIEIRQHADGVFVGRGAQVLLDQAAHRVLQQVAPEEPELCRGLGDEDVGRATASGIRLQDRGEEGNLLQLRRLRHHHRAGRGDAMGGEETRGRRLVEPGGDHGPAVGKERNAFGGDTRPLRGERHELGLGAGIHSPDAEPPAD